VLTCKRKQERKEVLKMNAICFKINLSDSTRKSNSTFRYKHTYRKCNIESPVQLMQ